MNKFVICWDKLTMQDICSWMGEEGYRYCRIVKEIVDNEDCLDLIPSEEWLDKNNYSDSSFEFITLLYFVTIIDYFNFLGQTEDVYFNRLIPGCIVTNFALKHSYIATCVNGVWQTENRNP